MKSLDTLLKVARRRMDDLGVEATRLAQRIEQKRIQQASLLAREETEVQLAAGDIQFAATLPAYRLRVKQQTEEIGRAIAAEEATLVEVRERLSTAYQEKSKFEQLLEQEALRRAAERTAREQSQLDEVAINRVGFTGK
jgi:flagellar export protein FliJ